MAVDRQYGDPRAPARRGRAAQKGGAEAQGLGRSKGGLTTKLHAACDALGTPLKFIPSPGPRGDVLYAADLIEGFRPDYVIAERAYDAEHVLDAIYEAGAKPVIPPRHNRRHPHPGAPRPTATCLRID